MANISRTVDIIFQGKDNVSPATQKIRRGLRTLEGGIDSAVDKMDLAADKFKTMSEAAAALGAVLVGLALNEFRKYEDAWTDLVKVTEEGEAGLTGVSDEIREMSRKYGEDITSITKSVFEFKRSGLEASEALLATENALKLVIAGNAEMGESTQFLKQLMNGFKITADETTHVVDVLNIISDKYNTTVTELGIALSRISPSAEKMNITLDKTAALVTPIIEVFGSGEEASTAYRRGLLRLVNESPAVQKALADLGVSQREGPNKTLREGNEILNDYIQALQDRSKQEQLSYLTLLFGERQASKLAESIGQLAKVQEIELLASTVKTDYTIGQVNLKLETLDRTIGRLLSSVKDLGISFGYELEGGAKDAVFGITSLINSIGDAAREGLFDEVFSQFDSLGEQLRDYFVQLAGTLPKALKLVDYSDLISSIQRLLGTINEEFAALDLTTPEGLAKAIQFVINTMESATDIATGMLNVYLNVKDVIVEMVRAFNDMSTKTKTATGEALATSDVMGELGKTIGFLVTNAERAPEILSAALKSIGSIGRLSVTSYKLFGTQIQRLTADFLLAITTLANKATFGLVGPVRRAYQALKDEHANLVKDAESLKVKQDSAYRPWISNMQELKQKLDRAAKAHELMIDAFDETPTTIETDVVVRTDLSDVDAELDRIRAEITKKKADEVQTIRDQAADAQAAIGILGDEYLARYERTNADIMRMTQARIEYEKTAAKLEYEPPADEKFKAAQKKLLKEIDTNADIMETKIRGFSDIISSQNDALASSFDSIGESINATGDTLSELYRQAADRGIGMVAQQAIQRRIREEEARREEAFELQKQLTTAQIDLIKQRAAAMAAGDPVITVSGDGLQPHLEAFMWEILSAIQVRVNEDYGNFLLGIGAA